MSKYAPVAPVEVLLQMKARGFLNGYLLLLAHEVVEKPSKYKELLDGFNGTVILDNSLIELGKPVDTQTMLTAAAVVEPTFVVLPDKLNDREETVRMTREAMSTWVKDLLPSTGIMIAAQGKTPEEGVECVKEIIGKSPKENFLIGVPRIVANTQGTRAPLVQLLTASGFKVHLLGMSNFMMDDIMCAKMYGVTGIDSASPLRAGWEGKRYDGSTEHLRNREEYFTDCRGFSIDMAYNAGMISGMIGELNARA